MHGKMSLQKCILIKLRNFNPKVMFGKYLWFAVKVNVAIVLISLVIAFFSVILLIPIGIIFAAVSSPLVMIVIATLWIAIIGIIPLYLAFKYIYKKSHGIELRDAIIYSVGLMVIVNIAIEYFTNPYLDPTVTSINLLISVVVTSLVFYVAGRRVMPTGN